MKPPRFRYFAPTTVDEAVELLSTHADAAKVLAGGQSLVPMLNLRLARPEVLVDINRVESLSYLRVEDGHWRWRPGPPPRWRRRPRWRPGCRCSRRPSATWATSQIRNRGTVGGSIVHADPSAEMPAVLALLDGRCGWWGPRRTRDIPGRSCS